MSSFSAGTEDQRALDPVLWNPQCVCARVQLDPGAPGPGGLRDRRGPAVVSKDPALANQPGSDVHGLGRMQRWYIHWGCCYPGTLMEPEESVTVGTVMINSSKSNTTAGETER